MFYFKPLDADQSLVPFTAPIEVQIVDNARYSDIFLSCHNVDIYSERVDVPEDKRNFSASVPAVARATIIIQEFNKRVDNYISAGIFDAVFNLKGEVKPS